MPGIIAATRPHSKPKMKLLVLAQTPPPLHGQSLMVRTAVDGLPDEDIALEHVNLALSRSHADIGRWRVGKLFAVFDACLHTVVRRFSTGCDTLYYVPAPGKRGALYRDWLVMLLCRVWFRRLVLHWHAVGLGEWLNTRATAPERFLTHWLLGRADLAIVLTPSLAADAQMLHPRRVAVVPNGIADPGPRLAQARPDPADARRRILFLGAVTREKGALVLLEAVQLIRRRGLPFSVVFAGPVEASLSPTLVSAMQADPTACSLAGFVSGEAKCELLASCDLVCLPTFYRNEGQPLVLLEALAADRPLVVTAWRGLPETVPPTAAIVAPSDVATLADALAAALRHPPTTNAHRDYFLANFTQVHHVRRLATALRQLDQ